MMRRTGWGIAAAVLAYTALFYADILFQRRVTVFRDQYTIVMAIDWVVRFLSQWSWPPLWTPYQVLGKPLLAEPLAAIFYPVNWPARLLPFPLGYNASVAAHHALAFAGVYLLLRQRAVRRDAAALGGLLFAFGGLCVAFDNMINALQSAVWLPWTLLAFDRWCLAPSARLLAATAIGLALTLLGGMPEVFGFALATCLAVAVDRRRDGGASLARAALALTAAAVLGFALGAVQLLPTAEYLAHSSRASGLRTAGVVRLSLVPFGTLAFLIPRHYVDPSGAFHETAALWEGELADAPWAISLYLGPLLALLAAVDLPRARRRLWLAVGVAFLLLGWGGYLPGYTWLVDRLPLLRTARYPEKFLLVVHLLLAAGAAFGLDAALRDARRFRRVGAAALTLGLVYGLGALVAGYKPSFARELLQRDLLIGAALLLGIAALAQLGRRQPRLAALGLIAFAAVDLYRVNARLLPTLDWDELRRVPDSARVMASGLQPIRMYSDALGRPAVAPFPDSTIQEQHLLLFEVANYFGLANLNAPASINLRDHELLSALTEQVPRQHVAALFGGFNTQFVTSPKDLRRYPGLVPILAPRSPLEAYVYRVEGLTPRAYVPSQLVAVPRDEDAVTAMREGADPARQVAVAAANLPADAPSTVSGSVQLTAYRAEEVELAVRMDTAGVVVLTDSFYPGWEATVDDRPAPVLRANYFARGVYVPSGEHRVVFRYRPLSYRVGAWVSLAAAALIAVMLARPRL